MPSSVIVLSSEPFTFLASTTELINTVSSSPKQSSAYIDGVVVGSLDVVILLKSICISIDGDGAAIGDDERLGDDVLLLVLNFDR